MVGLQRAHLAIRVAVGVCIVVILFAVWSAIASLDLRMAVPGLTELVQAIESLINDVVFIALAIFFLVSWERRIKRARALKAIHELRSLAHVARIVSRHATDRLRFGRGTRLLMGQALIGRLQDLIHSAQIGIS